MINVLSQAGSYLDVLFRTLCKAREEFAKPRRICDVNRICSGLVRVPLPVLIVVC